MPPSRARPAPSTGSNAQYLLAEWMYEEHIELVLSETAQRMANFKKGKEWRRKIVLL